MPKIGTLLIRGKDNFYDIGIIIEETKNSNTKYFPHITTWYTIKMIQNNYRKYKYDLKPADIIWISDKSIKDWIIHK